MLGDWLIDVSTRRLQRGDDTVTLEPRLMAVLLELCRRPREVIGAEALLEACWPGEPTGDNPVHKVMAGLRRALQDCATVPRYIETIRKRGYCLIAPIHVLSEQGPRSRQSGWRGTSPFRGLEPFDEGHASVFFGRGSAVAALHARLGMQWERGHPLVVLLGPSGSGKTSLVRAGLIPAMLMAPAAARVRANRSPGELLSACTAATVDLAAPGDLDPWSALAGALLDWEHAQTPLLAGLSIDTLTHMLRTDCEEVLRLLRIGLAACALTQGESSPHAPPLLVLDRLEALFQATAEADVVTFVACIDRLVRSRLMVVLAVCRNDFYPSVASHTALLQDKERGAHMDLAPPDAQAIAQIIRLPARAADLIFGADPSGLNRLDDRLCADAMLAPDALPLLQYTLQELYLNRGPGNELRWDTYEALGHLDGAIGRRAETVLAGLPPAQQEMLANLFPRLIGSPAEEAAPTGRWMTDAELKDDDERALVQAFVEARLLVSDCIGGKTGFRVAHEALLRRWPRVTAWVSQHRASLATRDELSPWVRRWVEAGRSNSLLMPRGAALWQATRALAEAPRLFGDEERNYVVRSQVRLRRQARWRVIAVAGLCVLAVTAVLAAASYARMARVAFEREQQSQRLASFMLGDLADQLRPIGKLDLLHSIGAQGLQLFGQSGAMGKMHGETPHDVLQRAKALVVIGEVNSSRGKAQSGVAVPALREASQLLEPLAAASGVDAGDVYKTLGASAFWLGQIAFDAEDLETAGREMARYREACERWLAVAPQNSSARSELSFAINSQGSIAVKRGAWLEAGRWFAESLTLKSALLAERPQDTTLQDAVANSHYWLGLTAHVRGQAVQALALYDAARSTRVQLAVQRPDDVSQVHRLSMLDVRRAEVLFAMRRHGEAMQAMEGALATLKQVGAHDPSNLRWRTEALHAQAGLLLMRLDMGLPSQGTLAELKQQLSQQTTTELSKNLGPETLARVAAAEAVLAAARGHWREVLVRQVDAAAHLQGGLHTQPQHWQGRELQARLGLLTLKAHAALGESALRADACERLRSQLQPAIDAGQAGLVLEAWSLARTCSAVGAADAKARK
jgi:DNA-binding winged helix-turn-helix (wHTH) protein